MDGANPVSLRDCECDLPGCDLVCTPTQTLRTRASATLPRPRGVEWEKVSPQMLEDIGALRELRELQVQSGRTQAEGLAKDEGTNS